MIDKMNRQTIGEETQRGGQTNKNHGWMNGWTEKKNDA